MGVYHQLSGVRSCVTSHCCQQVAQPSTSMPRFSRSVSYTRCPMPLSPVCASRPSGREGSDAYVVGGGGEGQTHATTPTMMDGHSHRHGHVRVQRKSARCACRHLRSSVLSGETPAMPLARICSTTAGPSFST